MMRPPAPAHLRNYRSRRSEAEPHWYGSRQSLADQRVVACQACALVEPARSCLMAASPFEPARGVAGRLWPAAGGGQQPLHFVDGERDQAGVAGRRFVWPGGWRRLGAGAVPEVGGGDGADGEGGHDEHEVAEDRGVEPCLALVQAEVILGVGDRLRGFDRLPADAEITNPRHPLAGQRVPVVAAYRCSGVVWLTVTPCCPARLSPTPCTLPPRLSG